MLTQVHIVQSIETYVFFFLGQFFNLKSKIIVFVSYKFNIYMKKKNILLKF